MTPSKNPRRTRAPEYCISSRKRGSFEAEEGGGFRKEGDGGEGEKKKEKRTRKKCSEQGGSCKKGGLCRHDFMKACAEGVQWMTHAQCQGVSF